MNSPCYLVLLLLLSILPCKAFVDNYTWTSPEAEAAMDEIANERNSYGDERSAVIQSYTGDKAQDCQKKALKQDIASVVYQTKMISLRQGLKGIDQQISKDLQNCSGDQQCMDDVTIKASVSIAEFKTQAILDLQAIKQSYLTNIMEFMGNCMTEE